MDKKIIAIASETISSKEGIRYVVVDQETGEVLDDAQGYGYRTKQYAYKAYAYKNRDQSKDQERAERYSEIRAWLKKNRKFVDLLDAVAWEIAKGGYGPDADMDAKMIRRLLKECGIQTEYLPREILYVWEDKDLKEAKRFKKAGKRKKKKKKENVKPDRSCPV